MCLFTVSVCAVRDSALGGVSAWLRVPPRSGGSQTLSVTRVQHTCSEPCSRTGDHPKSQTRTATRTVESVAVAVVCLVWPGAGRAVRGEAGKVRENAPVRDHESALTNERARS